jgi:hypothetical protein
MSLFRLIFLNVFFCFLSGFAQDVNYTFGEAFENLHATHEKLLEHEGNMLSLTARKNRKTLHITIRKLDPANLKLISEVEYTLPAKAKINDALIAQGKVYLFYTVENKKSKTTELLAYKINMETGKFNGGPKLLISRTQDLEYINRNHYELFNRHQLYNEPFSNVPSKYNYEYYEVFASANGKYLLARYENEVNKKSDFTEAGFLLLDNELNKIAEAEYHIPHMKFGLSCLDFIVNNKGEALLIAKELLNKYRPKLDNHPQRFDILSYTFDIKSGSLKKKKIDFPDVAVHQIKMKETKNGEIICAGFYISQFDSDLEKSEGAFMFRIDEFGNPSDVQYYEIPLEVLNQFKSNSVKKKNKRKDDKDKAEFEDLVMRELHVMEDGSILLIGEQYYVVERVSTDANGRTTRTYTYYYNDIFAVKINADGDLAWMRKLPKYQSTGFATGGSLSFNHFYGEGAHYFLYMDDTKNLDLTPDDRPKKYSDGENGSFSVYKVDDESGKVSKVFVFTLKDVNGMKVKEFRVNQIVQIAPNEFAVEFYKKSLNNDDVLIGVKVVN